ncbi:MAG: hypothetical protein IPP72_09015 [Chitinophagaceae bacterium]|nr:hypothetical protein [Chitinophagaceae bacterium]
MKKILLLAVVLLSSILLPAQGVYQLWGMTQAGGKDDQGVIFNTDGAGNKFRLKHEFSNLFNQGYGPVLELTAYKGKFYGMTIRGGVYNTGVIFEWNPNTGIYTKKVDLKNAGASLTLPSGKLTLSNGKFYGTSYYGANGSGAIFEWDPNTNIYTEKFDFSYSEDGQAPLGGLIMYGDKYYGLTAGGGSNYAGVIFEWDPATNVYTKKYDFNSVDGTYPSGGLTIYGCRLYGMTSWGGLNEAGVIFEWSPTSNVFQKKFDFDGTGGSHPYGNLTLLNGIFYGTTNRGGANNTGAIFKWHPATNIYYKQFDFNNANGESPVGSLIANNGKFFGLTNGGGSMNYGVIFEWNPSTNIYSKKLDFNGANGKNPSSGNSFTLVPAPVAKGLPGSCTTFLPVTINSSNNNQWISITDDDGNAVAEIKANGNNLGIVTASMFINNTAVREDASKRLYLDRNITITAQVQPTTAVDIRLYIKGVEYEALKNAVNSNGQSAGIDSISDITVYKVSDG